MKLWILLALSALLSCLHVPGESEADSDNPALLGLAAVPAQPPASGLRLVLVLPGSPAARAGLVAGDRLTRLDKVALKTPASLDSALRIKRPGDSIRLVGSHADGEDFELEVELIARKDAGEILPRGRPRGELGFEAPAWYGYAWANLGHEQDDPQRALPPPSRAETRGKVVVIHAFQSW